MVHTSRTRRIRTTVLLLALVAAGCDAPTPEADGGHRHRANLARGPAALTRIESTRQAEHIELPNPRIESARLPGRTVDARLLVICADEDEPGLQSIRQILDTLGTPYDVEVASSPGVLTADRLQLGSHGRYQGVVLTTGNLAYSDSASYRSAFSDAEWQTLWNYENAFGVRQVTWYTYPTTDYGFAPSPIAGGADPVTAALTERGAEVFADVNAHTPLVVADVWSYRASPLRDGATTPLLQTVDGEVLAAIRAYSDGRENLAMTFDGNVHSLHSLQLAYGAIRWVTRGLFLGERRVYMSAQVDDVFLASDIWPESLLRTYRMTSRDLDDVLAWQRARRSEPLTASFRFDMAYNGEGTVDDDDADALENRARAQQAEFKWINHTYTHQNLDAVSYEIARREVGENVRSAAALGFFRFSGQSLVTPEISGLSNGDAMRALFDAGVRYVVSDTSRPEGLPASPNTGIRNPIRLAILEIPRRPTNLFYNVSTPSEWVGEYNEIYRSYWGRDLTFAELLDVESDFLVRYMLRFEVYPWMFHQANFRAYREGQTLLTDLLDATLRKYSALMNLEVQSPEMHELGRRLNERMGYLDAGVRAVITPDSSLSITAARAARVPVTGLDTPTSQRYGGDAIGYVDVLAGETVTLPLGAGGRP
jgi:hypothetical protein